MEKANSHRKITIERKHVESLLFHIAMFLSIGGVAQKEAQKEFVSAYRRAVKLATGRKIENIEYPIDHADIVGLWMRDKRFLDMTGRPRTLSLRGKNSFVTLVRLVNSGANPSKVLKTLIRYGNVRRVRDGRYCLVRSFFSISTPKRVAFEPSTYFLADASETLEKIFTRTKQTKSPEDFWQKVENTRLSAKSAKRFLTFSRQRTIEFLGEMDEWLEANSETSKSKKSNKKRRVGLGVFSVYSKPNN